MGRRPDPAGVKAAKSPVRSRRKSPPAAPAPELEVADVGNRVPAGLKGDAAALWLKLAPMLRDMRLLSPVDEHVLARYCRNFAKWAQLRAQLDKRGYTYLAVSTSGGKLRRIDPSFGVADRLERQLLALEDRFGMSPSERQRIMTQRAAPSQGGLFPQEKRPNDPAAEPTPAAEPIESPIGMLQ